MKHALTDSELANLSPLARQWVRAMTLQLQRAERAGKNLDDEALDEIAAAYLSGVIESARTDALIKHDGSEKITPHSLRIALVDAGRCLGLTYGPPGKD